jgi:glycosyltransferase involved in cell wall biosynthesis
MTNTPEADHASVVVLFGTNWPQPGGGGLSIAYEFLRGLGDGCPLIEGCALMALFGEHVLPLNTSTDAAALVSQQCRSQLPRPLKWLVQAYLVWRLTARYRTTVVLAFTSFYAGGLLAGRRGLSIVHSEHSKGGLHTEYLALTRHKTVWYYAMRLLARLSLRAADQVLFPSRGALGLYARSNPWFPIRRSSVVYNGIADPWNAAAPSACDSEAGEVIVLNVAKHVPEKGLPLTLEGFALWRKRSSCPGRARLVNIGGPPEVDSSIATLVSRLNLESCCDFLGWQPRLTVLTLLRRAALFLLTPSVAVFDVALLEAMAMSKAIVSTPVGGNVEALGADYRYYARTPEEISTHLQDLLENHATALAVGTGNRQRFLRSFGVDAMIDGYWSVLRPHITTIPRSTEPPAR